jgi:putative FmdB family regulatory protein
VPSWFIVFDLAGRISTTRFETRSELAVPIYEYTCKQCDNKFEQLVRTMSGNGEKVKCPECGSTKTARALSLFAVSADKQPSAYIPSRNDSAPTCGRCGGPPGSCSM